MEEKKKRDPTLYENSYEFRKEWLWAEVKTDCDLGYPNIVSFFVKSGRTPVSGKVFTPPAPEFEIEIDIARCFTAIKDKMMTKGGKLRANMTDLKEYEVQAWSELLNYIWTEKRSGVESKLLLTKREYGMLFMSGTKNKKK